jgi:dTDP-4-dehydrorhamnose 3,5-epimerase-like enzyme
MTHSYTLSTLKNIPTKSFTMTALELKEYIEWDVKRVYFLTSGVGDRLTGSHCHLKDEDELFIMVAGSCTIVVDDGSGLTEIELTGPNHAISIPHMVWHHFKNLSDDAVICALSSTNYSSDRSDYCEDYQEFQKLVKC